MSESLAFDAYIDQKPFRVNSYQRATTDDLSIRFGSSSEGQTNLDLLKAVSQLSFRGGMFQKVFRDPEMAAFIRNAHYNPLDERLYFTPEMKKTVQNGGWHDKGITAWCYHDQRLFFATRNTYSTPLTNKLYMMDLLTGNVTMFTLPSAVLNSQAEITSIVGQDNRIYIAGKSNILSTGFVIHRLDYSTTAGVFTALAGTTTFRKLCFFRDKLYAIGILGLHIVGNFATGTATYTSIKNVGVSGRSIEGVHDLFEFNGALYVTKVDGLFRYDGTDVHCVFSYKESLSATNFNHKAIFNGRLYFSISNRLYRFDGSNLEMIQDFSDAYTIIGLTSSPDRLWINIRYNEASPGVYDSPNFNDPIAIDVYKYGLITWNDVGFYEYANEIYRGDFEENPESGGYGEFVFPTAIPVDNSIFWFFPNNYYNASMEGRSTGFYYKKAQLKEDFDFSKVEVGKTLELYGSVFDANYPAVSKTLNGVKVNYTGDGSDVLSVVLSVRYSSNGVLSGWVDVWNNNNVNTTDGVGLDYLLHDESTFSTPYLSKSPFVFDQIEYRLSATVLAPLTMPLRIKDLSYRYTLQPRSRMRWQLSVPIYGKDNSSLITSYFVDGTEDTRHAREIRSMIMSAYRKKIPILFYDLDYTTLINDVEDLSNDTITVRGDNFLLNGDYVAIKTPDGFVNRKIKDVVFSGGNTTFKLTKTGHRLSLGAVSSASAPAGSMVRKSYAAYITKIDNERVVINEETVNDDNGSSDYLSDILLTIVEV